MPNGTEPKLTVQLKLDNAGNPTLADGDGPRRYNLILEVENAPSDVYAATFKLDPSTSYDAVHTLTPGPNGGLRLETTTRGDSPVVVRLRRSTGQDLVLTDSIYRGLRRMYVSAPAVAPPVSDALSYIAQH